MRGITPFLWFENEAEEAARFYVSVFPNSKIVNILRYGKAASEGSGMPEGSVLTVDFQLDGQDFVALNGGDEFQFTPAISLMVNCETQEEIDHLWEKLGEGGKPLQCGWITDRFGVTWQVTPIALLEMIQDDDEEKSERVMKAMMEMVKLDIAKLEQAYNEQPSRTYAE